ncbi:UpxY family transcription antiterminator [Leeuwenhoekiella nanhaiensis]|uniref:Antitermination protein NusG n=1 Tax=Leeuwenhoekiella nanhaiensis TaxID=1655491 RepID=A0A2G1VNE2_9FLAO|nr:UpxY family transcription antiterminator [Leeuwenhoekiella nanhaiensis]PHQ28295.1 antitermination protein NusG [Leeuwenhoekiella nanhaiensis]
MNWYVLYVKSQTEKKTATALERMGLEVFCPTKTEVRQWSDRKKKVKVPLFKSYVFVRLSEEERQQVFVVHSVVRYLFWLGKPAVVRDEELETVKKWLADELVEEVQVRQFSPGDRVEIKGGVFKGQSAVVDQTGSRKVRLILKHLGVIVEASYRDLVS